ncbi:MAG: LacI family DNA-binding transcriptional regulator [Pseudomonadota bacterium]
MAGRVTLHDVARRANCSVATVSRVLNNTGPASAETRARVERAVAELGFRFNEIGRSLQSKRSRTLGIMVPTLSNPVFAAIIEGIQAAARLSGYQILLACAYYDPEEESRAIDTLLAKQVDGLLLTLTNADKSKEIALLHQADLPFVLIFNQPEEALPAVTVDNSTAARDVAKALLDAGHRKVAYVAGRFRSSDRSERRYQGFTQAFAEAGAPPPVLVEVDYDRVDHRAVLTGLFARQPDTTALFCSNDMLALAVMADLRRMGMSLPEDISIVGFDGIAVSTLITPSLATVVTPCHAMGRRAASGLIDAIENRRQPPAGTLLLPYQFRPGESLMARPGRNRPTRSAPTRAKASPLSVSRKETER